MSQILPRARHFASVVIEQISRHGAKIFSLVSIETGRFYCKLELALRDGRKFVGRRIFLKQTRGHDIDKFVSALGGQDRGDQQLERGLEIQFTMRIWISLLQFLGNNS